MRLDKSKPPESLSKALEFVEKVGATNLRLAPDTGALLAGRQGTEEMSKLLAGRVGVWLLNTPQRDLAGELWNVNAPLGDSPDRRKLSAILAIAPDAPVVLDAVYNHHDQEYLDAKLLGESSRLAARAG